jgi:hypothetical protein
MAACVRSAWLVLGSNSLLLEDPTRGYFCTSLDLGYPTVRAVMNPKPDQSGADDRTSLFAERAVTANITALAGAGATIDAVAGLFAPYMNPAARPVLHYILDRPGAPERTMVVRAAGYAWPVAGPYQRDIQLAFVAADPAARATTPTTVTAMAGTAAAGRVYNLAPNRTYPAGTAATTGVIHVVGDVAAQPLLRIYGPLTGAQVDFQPAMGATQWFFVYFASTFAINAGDWVDVDCANRTALYNSDPTRPVLTSLDWVNSKLWPAIGPGAQYNLTVTGANPGVTSQAQAIWTEGYLT